MVDIKAMKVAVNIAKPIVKKIEEKLVDKVRDSKKLFNRQEEEFFLMMAAQIIERELNMQDLFGHIDASSYECRTNYEEEGIPLYLLMLETRIKCAERFIRDYQALS